MLSGWEYLTPPGWDTSPSQVSSQQMLVTIYSSGRKESWVCLCGKEGRTNIRISAVPGIELGTLWLESRDLSNFVNYSKHSINCDTTCSTSYTWSLNRNRRTNKDSKSRNRYIVGCRVIESFEGPLQSWLINGNIIGLIGKFWNSFLIRKKISS